MKLRFRTLLPLLALVAIISIPSAALASNKSGGGGGVSSSCQTCAGGYDYNTGTAAVNCADAGDNQWGSSSCHVSCTYFDQNGQSYGSCTCDDTQNLCLVIFVQGN